MNIHVRTIGGYKWILDEGDLLVGRSRALLHISVLFIGPVFSSAGVV